MCASEGSDTSPWRNPVPAPSQVRSAPRGGESRPGGGSKTRAGSSPGTKATLLCLQEQNAFKKYRLGMSKSFFFFLWVCEIQVSAPSNVQKNGQPTPKVPLVLGKLLNTQKGSGLHLVMSCLLTRTIVQVNPESPTRSFDSSSVLHQTGVLQRRKG